jgi:shikimate dehydrogenase
MSIRDFINSETKILCVIGHPIKHSMSPIMHNVALQDLGLNYVYLAFDIKTDELKNAINGIKTLDIKGINVTIPHKETIIQHLDEIDSLAEKIGAINAIKNEKGKLIGKNTDVFGAQSALKDSGFKLKNKKVMIIGAGGAAKAISYSLGEEIDKLLILNRTKSRAIKLAEELVEKGNLPVVGTDLTENILKKEIGTIDLLINTTPVGMFPNIEKSPIPKKLIHEGIFVFDIIYNPLETKLIKDAKERGCKTLGGLDMLVNQGALAFEWWTAKVPNKKLMKEKVKEFMEL